MEKILLVDDDQDLLLVLTHALRAHGYAVTALADPSIVLQTIAAVQPGIIILDINMGQWDGRIICEQVKAMDEYNQIPVVLYSGVAEDKDTLLHTRASLFLHKPLSTSYFLKKIGELTPA
jgi:DNA-binding response OmpR family regulator